MTENTSQQNQDKPAEKSVASLEQEARQRLHTEQVTPDKSAGHETHKPAVTALNKRRKGRAMFVLLALLVLLIALAWGGTWVYRNFLRAPATDKQTENSDGSKPTASLKRNNLGQEAQPWEQPETSVAKEEEGKADPGSVSQPPPAPVRLNRAQALAVVASSAATAAPVMTRAQESQAALAGQASAATPAGAVPPDAASPKPSPVKRIPYNPDLYIPELTPVSCSLDFRFVSDLSGKASCTISQDIYSASGRVRLIEKGTQAFLEYRSGTLSHGQGRVFIIVNKLRTRQKPYLDIPLTETAAAGELGESGASGWIDNHWVDRFSGALMVGMIPDAMAGITGASGKTDRNTDYTENSRESLASMAKTTLDNSINIPPTLYKNQGEIITLIIGQDIDFSNIYQLRIKG